MKALQVLWSRSSGSSAAGSAAKALVSPSPGPGGPGHPNTWPRPKRYQAIVDISFSFGVLVWSGSASAGSTWPKLTRNVLFSDRLTCTLAYLGPAVERAKLSPRFEMLRVAKSRAGGENERKLD